jgi:hypothetical protein
MESARATHGFGFSDGDDAADGHEVSPRPEWTSEDGALSDAQSDSGYRDAAPNSYRFGYLDFGRLESDGMSDDEEETMASAFIQSLHDQGGHGKSLHGCREIHAAQQQTGQAQMIRLCEGAPMVGVDAALRVRMAQQGFELGSRPWISTLHSAGDAKRALPAVSRQRVRAG